MDDAYQDFVSKFLSVIDFVAPTRTLIVKSNNKPCFDIDVINAIRNQDKHHKTFKQSGKEAGKGNFKCTKLLLKRVINNKKTLLTRKNC